MNIDEISTHTQEVLKKMFLRADMNLLQFSAEYNIILCETEKSLIPL